jgi:hypothetical protein
VLGPVFMICAAGLVFGGTEGVESRLHVFRSRSRFRRYRGRPIPFFKSTEDVASRFHVFACPDSFSAVPMASGPFSCFALPDILIFDGTEGVESNFHVLHARTHFRRNRGSRVPFSCFALPDSFSAVPRASDPVFMSFAPGHVFGGLEGVGSLFHVLRSKTHFRRYRGCHVPISCFALPDSFSAVPIA